jgi:hypothetical protein
MRRAFARDEGEEGLLSINTQRIPHSDILSSLSHHQLLGTAALHYLAVVTVLDFPRGAAHMTYLDRATKEKTHVSSKLLAKSIASTVCPFLLFLSPLS